MYASDIVFIIMALKVASFILHLLLLSALNRWTVALLFQVLPSRRYWVLQQ
jgi:hypothetical protein